MGPGALTAVGGDGGAGIGGGANASGEGFIIEDAVITAQGAGGGAGIGGGIRGKGDNFMLDGSLITASGGWDGGDFSGAGIGSGGGNISLLEIINIGNGSLVFAKSGSGRSPAIGTGSVDPADPDGGTMIGEGNSWEAVVFEGDGDRMEAPLFEVSVWLMI